MDRRTADKRGGGLRPLELQEAWGDESSAEAPDEVYERAVFWAKVEAALRRAEREVDFLSFSIFRMRVLEGRSGKEVARALRISEPTVTRRLAAVRARLREHLQVTIATYSFTEEEKREADRNGLGANPTKADDALFDEAVAEIYRRQSELRARESGAGRG